MSEDDDGAEAQPAALLQTSAHKSRADAFALICGRHGHGRESHDFELELPDEDDRRKHDMPDDAPIVLCDQRDHWVRLLAQRIHEAGLGRALERFDVERTNRRAIRPRFEADLYKRVGLVRHTAQVSTDAKLTHKRYGTKSNAARRLIRQNAAIVATMSARSIRISTAASAP